jgi:Putative zinc-finger
MLFNLPIRIGGGRGDTNEHVLDQLSAYIDYELSDTERERVRDHLRRCPVCENELATLKAAKQLLNELPLHPVPRTFILTPDMVGRGVTGPVERRRPLGWTLAGRLRTATALVAVLLVLVLSGDVLSRGVLGGSSATLMAPTFPTPSHLLPQSQNADRMTNPTTVALAEATTTTVAPGGGGAGGLGAGPGEAPIPQAAPTVAAAAPSDSANQTTSAAPVPTGEAQKYAATPEAAPTGAAADQAQPPPAFTMTRPAEVAPAAAPQVSGW